MESPALLNRLDKNDRPRGAAQTQRRGQQQKQKIIKNELLQMTSTKVEGEKSETVREIKWKKRWGEKGKKKSRDATEDL